MLGLVTRSTDRMKKVDFPAGKQRQVCVSKAAIEENVKTGKTYPTVLVVEDGKTYEFHAADVKGLLSFDATRTDIPAKVFIETDEEFSAYVDQDADQTFLNLPKKSNWWQRLKLRLYNAKEAFLEAPIINCISGR